MPIQALTKKDFETSGPGRLHQEYIEYLQSCRVGNGGRLIVADEGTSRQTVKNRLDKAAEAASKSIKFRRSPATEVVFQVVE